MAKYKLKTELISNKLAKGLGAEIYTEGVGTADRVGVEALSALVSAIPLIGFLLPSVMSIFQGGVGQLYTQDGAKTFRPFRLPPDVVINLWRRGLLGELGMPDAFEDLAAQGWDDKRINAAIRSTEIMPTPQDLTSWLAHEVLEPEIIKKYGLEEEWEKLDKTWFGKIGMPLDVGKNYWINHWQHASWTQIIEMRRRDLITDADVWDWFRLVEIPPYWRERLMALIWEIPTRVDVRRWWDMRTISETDLREIYGRRGYHGKDLEDYVLWTKVYTAFPDLMSRYKNGWISEEDVKAELTGFGMSAERTEELWQTKIKKPHQAERVEETRKLTRALIIKGAKQGKVDQAQTIALLKGLNYADFEAEFIYSVEIVGAESPETPADFRKIVADYRRAVGMDVHELTEAALSAERFMLEAQAKLKEARDTGAPQADILTLEALAEEAKRIFEARLAESEAS